MRKIFALSVALITAALIGVSPSNVFASGGGGDAIGSLPHIGHPHKASAITVTTNGGNSNMVSGGSSRDYTEEASVNAASSGSGSSNLMSGSGTGGDTVGTLPHIGHAPVAQLADPILGN